MTISLFVHGKKSLSDCVSYNELHHKMAQGAEESCLTVMLAKFITQIDLDDSKR